MFTINASEVLIVANVWDIRNLTTPMSGHGSTFLLQPNDCAFGRILRWRSASQRKLDQRFFGLASIGGESCQWSLSKESKMWYVYKSVDSLFVKTSRCFTAHPSYQNAMCKRKIHATDSCSYLILLYGRPAILPASGIS